MPRRRRVFVDGATHLVDCPYAHGARVFAAPEEAFGLQVDAVEAELSRRLCMSGPILNLSTMPDLVPILVPIHPYHLHHSPLYLRLRADI